jgi:hypothetical protein
MIKIIVCFGRTQLMDGTDAFVSMVLNVNELDSQ